MGPARNLMTGSHILYRWAPCPLCATLVRRCRVFYGTREMYAGKLCMCERCAAPVKPPDPALVYWRKEVPAAYQSADPRRVHPAYQPALQWKASSGQNGVAIIGPSGAGKTHAMALVSRCLPYAGALRWITGAAMRQLAINAATLDGAERTDARQALGKLRDCPALIIDDLAEVKFTEAWADKLFEILEYRNSTQRITCWTAQHGPGQLAQRISAGRDVDPGTGNAIERRLCQHHALFIL